VPVTNLIFIPTVIAAFDGFNAPRLQYLSKINDILEDHIDTSFDSLDSVTKIQMIIDCTKFRNSRFELNDIAEHQSPI
jgi:hypothetical protein